jgi:acetyl-CoA C-acetyltransferase
MKAAYLISACRTPVGKYLGSLAGEPATRLGALVVREAVTRASVAAGEVEEVLMGNILSAGLGQAPARQAALGAGLPPTVAAVTINKMCGSGLKAVMLADQAIRCGDARCIAAGGMESMSRAPHLLMGVRGGWRFGHQQAVDSLLHDGLWCAFEQQHMGAAADSTARAYQISRQQQDAYALESHRRAVAAAARMAAEMVPVAVASRKGPQLVERDEGPRSDTSLEALARLEPAFSPEGTVTAGNASQMSDGAAAVVVADEQLAASRPSPIRARIVAAAVSGVPPGEIFISPVSAVQQVLRKAGLRTDQIDLYEINEAFAAQTLACIKLLDLDPARVNVHGGAIALGHPLGASGARVLVTLLYALADRGAARGVAALCLGGGNAVAMLVEREPG